MVMRRRPLSLVLAMLVACAVAACSGTDDPADAGTTNPPADTGPHMDATAATDTGTPPDSGPPADSGSDTDTGVADTGGALRAFGAACTMDSQCASNTCRVFGMLGMVCTLVCTMDNMCPVGSQGMRCNMNGLCRP